MNAHTDHSQRWWHRLLKVIYSVLLLICLAIAVSLCTGLIWINDDSDRSMFFFILPASVFGITVAFEIVRRTVFYITSGKDFLSVFLPRHIKILVATSLLLLISGGFTYVFVDMPKHAAFEKERATWYVAWKDNLVTAEGKLKACVEKSIAAKDVVMSGRASECERKREIERGLYNDCREGGYSSHAFCISLYDYEAINCTNLEGGITAQLISNMYCNNEQSEVDFLENLITKYEAEHPTR